MLPTNRFLADPLQPYGRIDIGAPIRRHGAADDWLIGDGWHAPEREGPITFRWAASPANAPHTARPCGAAARAAAHPRLRLSRRAAAGGHRDRERSARATRRLCASVPVTPEWQTVECTADARAWRGGVNRARAALRLRAASCRRRRRRRHPAAGRGDRLDPRVARELSLARRSGAAREGGPSAPCIAPSPRRGAAARPPTWRWRSAARRRRRTAD